MSTALTAARPLPRARRGLVDGTLRRLARAATRARTAERLAHANGLLQRIDPRIKLVGILALVLASALAANLLALLGLMIVGALLAALSRIRILGLIRRLWFRLALFTGPLALPALFLTAGDAICHLPVLGWPVTAQGLRGACFLILRAESAATFSLLLVLCTPWPHLLKALRVLRVPALAVVLLSMTQRYLFMLLQAAEELCEARQSRTVGRLTAADRRRWAVASVGVLLERSVTLSGEVHLAMLSRGFRGEVYTLHDFRSGPSDWLALAAAISVAAAAVWPGWQG